MSNSRKMIIAAVIAGVIIAAAAAILFSTNPTNATVMKSSNNNSDPNASRNQEIISQLKTATTAGASALGSSDAEVTIVEFGDYQCTWCHRWHDSTKETLIADYVNTGKVRFLFKDFPINDLSDRASSLAAEASYCAGDQSKYWQYHDELYGRWGGENTGWVTKQSLAEYASNVGLEAQQFSECLDSGKYGNLVRQNYNLAVTIGLNSTPSFVVLVDGEIPKLIPGAQPYKVFQQVIDPVYAS